MRERRERNETSTDLDESWITLERNKANSIFHP